MSEVLLGNKQWHRMFSHIKNATLHCFRRPDDITPEVTLPLDGLVLLPANISKHKMALALAEGDTTKLYIEVSVCMSLLKLLSTRAPTSC